MEHKVKMDFKKEIRQVPNFPKEGINFIDITTLLKNGSSLKEVVNLISGYFNDKGITKVVGLESRGFICGGAIACNLNAGFVPVRKKGKLPAKTFKEIYELEYGTDEVEIHMDALEKNDVVLIHDDLLATGGTAYAAMKLIKNMEVKEIYFSFICNLNFIRTTKKDEIFKYDTQILAEY